MSVPPAAPCAVLARLCVRSIVCLHNVSASKHSVCRACYALWVTPCPEADRPRGPQGPSLTLRGTLTLRAKLTARVKLALRGRVALRAKSTLRAKLALRGSPAAPGTPAREASEPRKALSCLSVCQAASFLATCNEHCSCAV